MKPLIFIGDGGHARVLIDLARCLGREVFGVSSPTFKPGQSFDGVNVIGNDHSVNKLNPANIELVNAVGSTSVGVIREKIYLSWKARGFCFASLVHPSAVVAKEVRLGEGCQIMGGVVVQTGSIIGDNCILNTCCSLDHDCNVAAHSHLAPGVIVCGGVSIGERSHIGAGSTLIQGVSLGGDVFVAAGATVVQSSPDRVKLRGTPARIY